MSLREKGRYLEFFWSVFSRTEYREIVRKFSYSVKMRENTNQKNSAYGHFSRSVYFDFCFCSVLNTRLHCNNIEKPYGEKRE